MLIQLIDAVAAVVISTLSAVITYYNIPTFNDIAFVTIDFIRTLSAALLIDILTITICIAVRMSTLTRQELREERA